MSQPVNSQPSSNKKAQQPSLVSPAPGSVGAPVTPVFTPKGSVRTPGGADLLSPQCGAPPSNGPLTPMDSADCGKQPSTPKSVPSYPIPSPFDNKPKSVATPQQPTPTPAVPTNPPSVKSENMTTQVIVKTEPMDDGEFLFLNGTIFT